MSLKTDLNSIVDSQKVKVSIPDLPAVTEDEHIRTGGAVDVVNNTGNIVGPLTLEILTYKPDPILIQANNGDFYEYEVETAKIIDANDKEFLIDEIIYPTPP